MSELVATVERLRVVKLAFREFLTLWAIDSLFDRPSAAARLSADLDRTPPDRFGRHIGFNPGGRLADQ